jgi:hypothetical protein
MRQSRMTTWRVIRASILFVLLCGYSAPGAAEPDVAARLDSLLESLPHANFAWIEAEGVSNRAAMRIPVKLDGTEGWFQLDTGLDATLVYGNIPSQRGWETHEGMCHVPDFQIGSMHFGPTWLHSRTDSNDEGELIGSLGLDLLVGYLLLIDYPGCRLTLMKPGEAPLWVLQHMTWTPAELRDAKFFLTVVLGGESVRGIFFDTGASAFDITVDFDEWVNLTGCSGPDDAVVQWTVRSWGNEVTAVGCPARGPLVIGSARIPNPRIFYLKEQPRLFADWPFPATGLVGCAPFWDRIVIMDLGIRPRFGLLQ